MPYRHAHYWLIALVAIVPLAFWPGYFSPSAHRTAALHAHAAAATFWLVLLIVQSWSASVRNFALHRIVGRSLFIAVPLFAGGGAMAIIGMARHFADATSPFHVANAARLTICDLVALVTFVGLTTLAVAQRRRVRVHAAAMLATPLLVLPPVLGRAMGYLPGFPHDGAFGLSSFALSFHLAEAIAALAAIALYRRDPRAGGAFLVTATASVVQMLLFATVGASQGWAGTTYAIAQMPMPSVALGAAVVSGAALYLAWSRIAPRRVPMTA